METVTSHQLQDLQTLLLHTLQQFPSFHTPDAMHCVLKRSALVIVLDYRVTAQLDVASFAQILKRSLLNRSIRQHLELATTAFDGSVCCYLRKMGSKKPIAKFAFKAPASQSPASQSPVSQSLVKSDLLSQISQSQNTLSSQLPNKRPHDEMALVVLTPPLLPAQPNAIAPSLTRLQSKKEGTQEVVTQNIVTKDRFALDVKRLPFKSWPKWQQWGVSISASVILGTVSLGVYALTRPCVWGACQLLTKAEAIHSPTHSTLEPITSFADALQTHRTLLDLSYQLRTVPFWSPHYKEVRSLLSVYDQQTATISKLLKVQSHAHAAAVASQSPPHPLDTWIDIEQQWQQAIQKLEPMAVKPIVNPLVETKLVEYEANLTAIQYRIERETAARTVIESVRQSIDVAKARSSVAQSLESWQQIQATWKTALEQLTTIPTDTMAHAEAAHLIAIYRPQWTKVRDRLQAETLSQQLYTNANQSAQQAIQSEANHQWTTAVTHWQDALDAIQQVPQDTVFYDQVLPLTLSYSTALDQAQQQYALVVAVQQVEQHLEQECKQIPTICHSVEPDTGFEGTVQVWLSSRYGRAVEAAMVSSGTKQPPNVPRDVAVDVNQLLAAIARAGKTAQIPIELYRADGAHVGRYEPEAIGYIQPHLALSERQVTLLPIDESR